MSYQYVYGFIILYLSSPLVWAEHAPHALGKTLLAQGQIHAERAGAQAALKRLSPIYRTDILRSGEESSAQFRMIDNGYLDLAENSELRLEQYQLNADGKHGNVVMELIKGGLRTISGSIGKQNKAEYQLKTPVATIGIRGTMYEVSLTKEGMYLAAWKGAITVHTYTGQCNTAIGLGEPAKFAFVNLKGQCELLTEAPRVFNPKRPQPRMKSTPEATELAAATLPTKKPVDVVPEPPEEEDDGDPLARKAIIINPASATVVQGSASESDDGKPQLKVKGDSFEATSQQVQHYSKPLEQFDVSWGRWAGFQSVKGKPVANQQGLTWISYQSTPSANIEKRSGSLRYDHLLASNAQSSMGEVTKLKVGMDVDFTSGKISNGTVSAQVPAHTWQGNFDGAITKGDLELQFQNGQLLDNTTQQSTAVQGAISGDFVGNIGQAIVGGFNMADKNNAANSINGAFLIQRPDEN